MLRFPPRHGYRHGATAPPWTAIVFGVGLAFGVTIMAVTAKHSLTLVPAGAASVLRADGGVHYSAQVLRIVDGDTFLARIHVRPGMDVATKVRLRRIDAPELHARCADEFAKAQAATQALRVMLADREVTLAGIGFDRYGRVLADVATRRTPDVGAAMLAQGMARPYQGGRRESWCGWKWW